MIVVYFNSIPRTQSMCKKYSAYGKCTFSLIWETFLEATVFYFYKLCSCHKLKQKLHRTKQNARDMDKKSLRFDWRKNDVTGLVFTCDGYRTNASLITWFYFLTNFFFFFLISKHLNCQKYSHLRWVFHSGKFGH